MKGKVFLFMKGISRIEPQKMISFVLLVMFFCLAAYALLPTIASADAAAITDGVNKGSEGVYGLFKSCVPYIAVLSIICSAVRILIDKDPRTISSTIHGCIAILGVLFVIYFGPNIIKWFIDVLENAGGGKWEQL